MIGKLSHDLFNLPIKLWYHCNMTGENTHQSKYDHMIYVMSSPIVWNENENSVSFHVCVLARQTSGQSLTNHPCMFPEHLVPHQFSCSCCC